MLRHVSRLLQLRRAYVGLPLAIRPLAVARGYSTGTGIAIDKIRNVAIIAHGAWWLSQQYVAHG